MFRCALVRASELPSLGSDEAGRGWLSPREEELLGALGFPARRRKWLLGRAAAKRLVRELLAPDAPPESAITILNRPSGEPYVVLEDRAPWQRPISISHRSELGLAATVVDHDLRIGADLETIEPRDLALVRQFFTDAEARLVEGAGAQGHLCLARIWSAKEAALKLLGLGLRADTRAVSVLPRDALSPEGQGVWHPVEVEIAAALREPAGLRTLQVVWRREDDHVLTVALGR